MCIYKRTSGKKEKTNQKVHITFARTQKNINTAFELNETATKYEQKKERKKKQHRQQQKTAYKHRSQQSTHKHKPCSRSEFL